MPINPATRKKTKKSEANAIHHNFAAAPAMPAAVKDLADLLAEIAVRRLRTIDQPQDAGPEQTK